MKVGWQSRFQHQPLGPLQANATRLHAALQATQPLVDVVCVVGAVGNLVELGPDFPLVRGVLPVVVCDDHHAGIVVVVTPNGGTARCRRARVDLGGHDVPGVDEVLVVVRLELLGVVPGEVPAPVRVGLATGLTLTSDGLGASSELLLWLILRQLPLPSSL